MVPLCSVSWTRNGSPLEGAFHSCSLEVQPVTLSVVRTSDHFNSCTQTMILETPLAVRWSCSEGGPVNILLNSRR